MMSWVSDLDLCASKGQGGPEVAGSAASSPYTGNPTNTTMPHEAKQEKFRKHWLNLILTHH